jgi:molybdopterin-guanine dinucleotide biosynthesis protein A
LPQQALLQAVCMNKVVSKEKISALILSGGQGRRLGYKNKGLIHWQGAKLIEHVINCINQQVDQIVISCNQNQDIYQTLGFQLCQDENEHHEGPISGINSSTALIKHPLVLVCACDTPKLPSNLVTTLVSSLSRYNADIAYPICKTHSHFLPALIKTTSLDSIQHYFQRGGRSLKGWYATQNRIEVVFTNEQNFSNFNHPEDFL